jgi:uncharacterized membrane protein
VSGKPAPAEEPPKPGGRVDAIDCARGVALVGMAAYHLSWDLADYRLVSPMLPFSPPMRLFSHAVASAFLALAGVSLALAHREGLNLPAFCQRLVIVSGAAALVTAASFVFAPGEVIWFGILHCIAIASLVAGPFVGAPASVSLLIGAAAIAVPVFIQSKLFDPPALLWLGLGETLPNTLDWRPLLPWGGAAFLGLGLARLSGVLGRLTAPERWRAQSRPARALGFAGRHSLPIYLVHQPVLIGLVAAAAYFAAPKPDARAFLAACERACEAGGRASGDCATSCQCVADSVVRSGDAERLGDNRLDPARKAELKRMAQACLTH